LTIHSKLQRPDASMQQKTGICVQMPTQVVETVLDLLDEIFSTGDDSRSNVTMTIECLGRTMDLQIKTILDRTK